MRRRANAKKAAELFRRGIMDVCMRHGLALFNEDPHGSLVICPLSAIGGPDKGHGAMPTFEERVETANIDIPETWIPLGISPTQSMIDVSTGHMPGPEPDFGKLRMQEHEYGWMVFVTAEPEEGHVPEWLQPIYELALQHECICINFDRDAAAFNQFPSWVW